VPVNHGDLQAAHGLFHTPEIDLDLRIEAEVTDESCGPD
jgi:hypothetical protein